MTCFLGYGPPCTVQHLSMPPLCGTHRCVAWCVVVVVWSVGTVCDQDLGAPPNLLPPPNPPSAEPPFHQTPFPRTPLRRTPQNFALFSLSRHNFHSFLLSLGGPSLNFGVFEGWDPQMCTIGVLGLSSEVLEAMKPVLGPHPPRPHPPGPHFLWVWAPAG